MRRDSDRLRQVRSRVAWSFFVASRPWFAWPDPAGPPSFCLQPDRPRVVLCHQTPYSSLCGSRWASESHGRAQPAQRNGLGFCVQQEVVAALFLVHQSQAAMEVRLVPRGSVAALRTQRTASTTTMMHNYRVRANIITPLPPLPCTSPSLLRASQSVCLTKCATEQLIHSVHPRLLLPSTGCFISPQVYVTLRCVVSLFDVVVNHVLQVFILFFSGPK